MENEKWEMENTGMENTVMGNTFFHSFFCFRLTVYNKEYIFFIPRSLSKTFRGKLSSSNKII